MKKTGLDLIQEERERSINVIGYTAQEDHAKYDPGVLSAAAACYALPFYLRETGANNIPKHWPWDREYWKPANTGNLGFHDRIRELQKAGNLIAAEIDLLIALGHDPGDKVK